MKHYTALIIEDDPDDTELLKLELSKLDFKIDCTDVDSEAGLRASLDEALPDIVISDYSMPGFTGLDALKIVREQKSDLPFILCSGLIGEEQAVDAVKNGVTDYCLKNNLERLGISVERELKNYEDHKKKNQRLKETRTQYENILKSVKGIVWEADVETLEFLYVSPQVEQILGFSPEEWLSEPNFWEKHIHPDDRDEAIHYCHYKSQHGENHEFEYRMLDANEEVVWLRDYVTVVTETGKPNRLCGLMIDISREKKAEHQRDKAYDIADIGHWELDLKNEELYWSNAVKNIHEVDPAYEPNLETAIEFYKEGEHRQKITRAVENAIETGESFEVELKILTANGNEKWVRVLGETDFRNGTCIRIYGSTQDISKRKISEIKYRDIFNLSPQSMWVYDPKTLKFLDVNQAAMNHYGFSHEEFMKMTLKDIRPEDDIPHLMKAVKETRGKKDSYHEGQFRHKTKDESIIHVNIKRKTIDYEGRKASMVLAEDVTDKLAIERELQLSEQRFKSLVQDGSDLIAILDQNGNYKYVAPTSESVLGISAEEFIGNNALDYIHDKHKDRILQVLATLPEKKRIKIEPFLFKDGKGAWRWIESIITNLLDNPAIEGFIANSRDVTVQIEREQKLRENLELYEYVTKATDDVVYDWDLVEDILHWDDSFHDKFIYNFEKGTYSLKDWAENVHPEDLPEAQKSLNDLLESTGSKWEQEYRFKKQDETYATVFERGFIIRDQNGEAIRMIGSLQDITERKEYEEELKELALVASKTTDVIFMTDPQEQITWINKAFEQFSGYQFDEVIGKSPGNILTGPDNDQKTMRRISKAFKKQETLQVIVLNYSKTGDKYWFDLTLDPIFDSNGQCEGFIGIQKNVTEQIEYQQELRKSVERYDIVSKATSDTIWDWNLAIDTIEYSQNFYEMFGYEQQQVNEIEDWWRDKIHPDDLSEVLDTIGKAQRSSSERFQMEYRFKVADDTYKYIYDRAFIVEDEEGNPIRIIGAMRDVSDQKEAQRKMKEAFQERQRILDRINEAFLATDQNWNVTYWNKQAQDVIGIIREDILGKNLWETFPEAKELKFFQEYKRALKEQVSVQFEEYYPPLEEWLEMNVYPSEEGLSVFFRNITERKDAEKSLQELYQKNRLVLESTDEGIYGIDTEGRCTFINRAATNMLGYRSEECIGKNMHKLIHHKFSNGEFYPESECPIYISKNKHESCRVTDEVFWRADGTCFNVEYTSSPMIQDGKIEGGVVAFSDITKRKQQEKELQESLEEKETLLLEVHHRVKNNLAIISSLITLQSMDVEDENFRNMLENTTSRIHSIAMVHELLYQSENFTEIPFEKYLKELLSKIKKIIGSERNHVDLVIKVEDGGRGLNINQAIPLGLMLNELMTNSLKYAFINRQKGKIVVNIARSGNTIKVLYEDNGDGYPDHIDFADTDSFGHTLIHTLLKQLSDDFKVETKGKFRLEFQFEERIRGAHSNYSG